MVKRVKHRLAREEGGFTLLELLTVITILGVLVAIAVPSYMSFRGRAEGSAAKADVRAAIPAVEAWGADHVGGWATATTAKLKAQYDAGFVAAFDTNAAVTLATNYCVYKVVGAHAAWVSGPGGVISQKANVTKGGCA